MHRFLALVVVAYSSLLSAQSPPASSPQALTLAAGSIAAMTGGNAISDVTLTGSVAWNRAADSGSAMLRALGTGESRVDLALSEGTRTEIRDTQTGTPLGKWINPSNAVGNFTYQNCQTDAVWFFPALGSLAAGPNVVLSYIGQVTRNGKAVQHIQSFIYQANSTTGLSPSPQQLSTTDWYLDAATLLPVAVTFSAHPDNGAPQNLAVEVDFSNYQVFSGVAVPTHIQRYQSGNLMVDITVSAASFNTGIPLSVFTVN